jgi:hypothetical protein
MGLVLAQTARPLFSFSTRLLFIWGLNACLCNSVVSSLNSGTLPDAGYLFSLVYSFFMLVKLLLECWNVRSLGQCHKRDDVHAAIELFLPSILCLQETKLSEISSFLASLFLPQSLRSFVFKPSGGASGGFLTAWNDDIVELLHHSIEIFSITTTFYVRADNIIFSVINVYCPCNHFTKPDFLLSLENIFASLSNPIAIMGDFNLLRAPKDKSNANFNFTEAMIFNDFINSLGLLEIPLLDKQFTWSNQQNPPILTSV